jgi:hypothetical protein
VDHAIEEHAPGFGSRVIDRFVQRPSDWKPVMPICIWGHLTAEPRNCNRC